MNKQKKKDELQSSIASVTLLSLVQLAFLIPLAWGVFHSENPLLRLGLWAFPSIWLSIWFSSGTRFFIKSVWLTAWRRTIPFEREVYL